MAKDKKYKKGKDGLISDEQLKAIKANTLSKDVTIKKNVMY